MKGCPNRLRDRPYTLAVIVTSFYAKEKCRWLPIAP